LTSTEYDLIYDLEGKRTATRQKKASKLRAIYVGERKILVDGVNSIKAKTYIFRVAMIAEGEGIREAERLAREYLLPNGKSTSKKEWLKMRGRATIIDAEGSEAEGEVHWYECKDIGRVEYKLKGWY
jgi:hypothetical protein